MICKSELDEMKNMDITSVDRDKLVDISTVRIEGKTSAERLNSFVKQVGNPYCFKVGNTPVRVSFKEGGNTLESAISRYFKSLKR